MHKNLSFLPPYKWPGNKARKKLYAAERPIHTLEHSAVIIGLYTYLHLTQDCRHDTLHPVKITHMKSALLTLGLVVYLWLKGCKCSYSKSCKGKCDHTSQYIIIYALHQRVSRLSMYVGMAQTHPECIHVCVHMKTF